MTGRRGCLFLTTKFATCSLQNAYLLDIPEYSWPRKTLDVSLFTCANSSVSVSIKRLGSMKPDGACISSGHEQPSNNNDDEQDHIGTTKQKVFNLDNCKEEGSNLKTWPGR